ncbi:hypothetical protein EVAR_81200_1 [Eumeta japonica]|uniref:Uncharacterized protein n=1 Tax=Eumeta variegata TaxID=151549 RepID=A0A4C1V0W0_EUMVA|nr:hypothetical protein EVAR_81200_1 [Eumeta japonica]
MLDARLNFKQQVEHVSVKASVVRAGLARLMPNVGGVAEDAMHVNPQRDELEKILNQRFQPDTLVEAMLSSKAAWNAISVFATEVLTDLRSIERKRAKVNYKKEK